MNRTEAIRSIVSNHPGAAFVFCNGLVSREAAHAVAAPGSLYLLHAMGEALSVAIGLHAAKSSIEIVVIDGDGNAAMGLAAWPLLDGEGIHYYVLANGEYETTGGQSTSPLPTFPGVTVIPIRSGIVGSPNPPQPEWILAEFRSWLATNSDQAGRTEDGVR